MQTIGMFLLEAVSVSRLVSKSMRQIINFSEITTGGKQGILHNTVQ